jgi:hypothetical protein
MSLQANQILYLAVNVKPICRFRILVGAIKFIPSTHKHVTNVVEVLHKKISVTINKYEILTNVPASHWALCDNIVP